jgi:hypothetical protein
MLLLARPLGSVPIPTGGVRIFPSALPEAYLKPTQEMRYLLACSPRSGSLRCPLRIRADAPVPALYDLTSPVATVRASTRPGKAVAILAPLGHQIALDASVENVSPYRSAGDILSYEQMDKELNVLREHVTARTPS